MAYAFDEIENPLAVGRVRNGGRRFAGPGRIDLDYLLGANGGHLNVNGVAGRGTKSSLLLHFNYLLLREARRQQRERPGDQDRLRTVPIILNVKNFDLFHIDRRSKRYDPTKHAEDWHALGIDDPAPFQNVTFYAPQMPGSDVPINTGRPKGDVKAYSWSLRDVVERVVQLLVRRGRCARRQFRRARSCYRPLADQRKSRARQYTATNPHHGSRPSHQLSGVG